MKHFLLFVPALLAVPAAAQPSLVLTSQTPARNAAAIPYAASVALTFSQGLSSSAASAGALRVYGSQRGGKLAGTASVSGSVLQFAPAHSFAPGEKVSISLTTAVQSSAGQPLSRAYVSQFTVAAVGGTGAFGGGSDPSAGLSSRKLISGDIDGDGDLDLLTTDWPNGSGGTITVRLNDGRGTFSTSSTLTLADKADGLMLADVDADNDLDLVLTLANSGSLLVRPNNGNGQFGAGTATQVLDFPASVTAADVDGDGDLDLLTANTNGTGTVAVCVNNGSGSFTHRFPDTQMGAFNSGPVEVVAADLDSDGDLDIVTTNSFNSTFAVGLNAGNGTFTASSGGAVGTTTLRPRRVLLRDINNDGNLDLLTVNTAYGAGSVSVRLGNGTGQFAGGYEISTGPLPFDAALADVDGDNDLDLLTSNNQNTGLVSVRLNNSGVFGTAADVAVEPYPVGLTTGDVDGDGDLDLVTVNNSYNSTLSVRFNGGTSAPLATRPQSSRLALEAYPNPAHEAVRVIVPAGTAELQVLDALGRLVRTVAIGPAATELSLPVGGLVPGAYVLRAGAATRALLVK
ncbi:FG-GAP-like repeat-containing protein [Hymenobacter daeguensis]